MKPIKVRPKKDNISTKIPLNPKRYIIKTTEKDEADRNLCFKTKRR